MSFLSLLKSNHVETRAVTSITGSRADGWTHSKTAKGSAETMAVTLACMSLISGAIASLPARVKRRTPRGAEVLEDHPVARLIREGVNDHQTYHDWIEGLVYQILGRGNGVSRIVSNARTGAIEALEPIDWASASITQLPSGRVAIDYTPETVGGGPVYPQRMLQGEFLHVRNGGRSRFVGQSVLQMAASSVDMTQLTEEHARASWANAAQPGAVLQHEKNLSEGATTRLKDGFASMFGGQNARKIAVLEEGLKYQPMPVISPVDSEILESRKLSEAQIAKAFGVPGVLVGITENASYNNVASLTTAWATLGLAPLVAKIEREFSRTVFSESERGDVFLDLDISALQRADHEARWQSHKIALETNAMTKDEVRAIEGLPALAKRMQEKGFSP